jgi:uncharacterized protein
MEPNSNRFYAVRRIPGAGWEAGRPLRSQPLWPEHATFMNGLLNEGHIFLGGPIGVGNDALIVFRADSESGIRARLALDPWTPPAILVIQSIEEWTILLK